MSYKRRETERRPLCPSREDQDELVIRNDIEQGLNARAKSISCANSAQKPHNCFADYYSKLLPQARVPTSLNARSHPPLVSKLWKLLTRSPTNRHILCRNISRSPGSLVWHIGQASAEAVLHRLNGSFNRTDPPPARDNNFLL